MTQPVDIIQPLSTATPGLAQWSRHVESVEGLCAGLGGSHSVADLATASAKCPTCHIQPHPLKRPSSHLESTWKERIDWKIIKSPLETHHRTRLLHWVSTWKF